MIQYRVNVLLCPSGLKGMLAGRSAQVMARAIIVMPSFM